MNIELEDLLYLTEWQTVNSIIETLTRLIVEDKRRKVVGSAYARPIRAGMIVYMQRVWPDHAPDYEPVD